MIDIARKILLHDKLRFAITVSGVAFAVMLVLVQVGLFRGILGNASITIEKASADLWVTSRNTANVDFSGTFSENVLSRVRSVPGVARADNLIVWYLRLRLPSGASEGVMLYGLEDFTRWNLPWSVAAGDLADLRRGAYLFLDASGMRRFGPFQPGDYREVMGRRLKIIGLTREAESFTTTPVGFLDARRLREIDPHSLKGKTTYILVKLDPGAEVEAVRAEIRRRLPFNDVHTRAEWGAQSRHYWMISTGLGLNMFLTVFLGCLVGVVIVGQTLYTSTLDHFKEFATVKAIGGTNAVIYRILIKQAILAAIAGFCVGAATSFAVRPVMGQLGLKMAMDPRFFGLALVGTVALCVAAALISFRKVAHMDPVLVFRS
jgi:putative ABC transport system permease protein